MTYVPTDTGQAPAEQTREIALLANRLKDLTHGLRTQPEDKKLMTPRQAVNIVINSEREANADLLCGSS